MQLARALIIPTISGSDIGTGQPSGASGLPGAPSIQGSATQTPPQLTLPGGTTSPSSNSGTRITVPPAPNDITPGVVTLAPALTPTIATTSGPATSSTSAATTGDTTTADQVASDVLGQLIGLAQNGAGGGGDSGGVVALPTGLDTTGTTTTSSGPSLTVVAGVIAVVIGIALYLHHKHSKHKGGEHHATN